MYEKNNPGEGETLAREFYGVWVTTKDGDEYWACDWAWIGKGDSKHQEALVTFSPNQKALVPLRETWRKQQFTKKAEICLVQIPGPKQ